MGPPASALGGGAIPWGRDLSSPFSIGVLRIQLSLCKTRSFSVVWGVRPTAPARCRFLARPGGPVAVRNCADFYVPGVRPPQLPRDERGQGQLNSPQNGAMSRPGKLAISADMMLRQL